MLRKYCWFTLVVASSVASLASAQQAAHVHGFATLNLVIDQDELLIEFSAPADSIVGFEYEPESAEEKSAVEKATASLSDPATLFDLPASAGCELHEAEVERHGEEHEDEHAEHEKHEEHEEHEEHAQEKHEEHAHEEHEEHGVHSEFHAEYHFECDGSAIEAIGLRLFETWPRIETLRVQALTPGGQTGGNIDAQDPVIRLK
jgi:G3E family GTPase